jgi:hypothetical protein
MLTRNLAALVRPAAGVGFPFGLRWMGLMLACILAASAGPAPSQQADKQSSPSAEDLNSPDAIKARMERSEKALSPAYIKRRRQAIAELLEKNAGYREVTDDAKLLKAQLAGPWVIIHKVRHGWFDRTTEVDIFYCAKAELDILFYRSRTAMIMIKKMDSGTENLQAAVGTRNEPQGCRGVKSYEPFAELEQARARRRQALGKSD